MAATKSPTVSYYRDTAPGKVQRLKEQASIHLANLFRQSGCTQTQVAEALGITQPRLSDAIRGKYEKFTLDRIYEMLFALGSVVKVDFETLPADKGGSFIPRERAEAEPAIAHYTALIAEEPGDAQAYARRAFAYMEIREREKAIADYTRAIELDPERPGYRGNRIVCYKMVGEFTTALFECDRMDELFPDYGTNQSRGSILEKLERFSEALDCHTKAIDENPGRPGPFSNRADLLEKLERYEEALADYKDAQKCDPENDRYRKKIAELEDTLKASG